MLLVTESFDHCVASLLAPCHAVHGAASSWCCCMLCSYAGNHVRLLHPICRHVSCVLLMLLCMLRLMTHPQPVCETARRAARLHRPEHSCYVYHRRHSSQNSLCAYALHTDHASLLLEEECGALPHGLLFPVKQQDQRGLYTVIAPRLASTRFAMPKQVGSSGMVAHLQ